jgi:D-arabinose 5-phosphate isomerase GutQ
MGFRSLQKLKWFEAAAKETEFPMRRIADHVVIINGRTKTGWPEEKDYLVRQIIRECEPLSLLGSVFKNNCMVFLDSLVVELIYRPERTEEASKRRHATIE